MIQLIKDYWLQLIIVSFVTCVLMWWVIPNILTRTTSYNTRWIRRLFWPVVKKSFSESISKDSNIFAYPMIIYLKLDIAPKEVYIDKGFTALKKHLLDHLDEMYTSVVSDKGSLEELIEQQRREEGEFQNKYPNSNLDYDEIQLIKQYEEEMKNSKS